SRPKCECPNGFSLLDPSDPNGDCKPDFTPSCDEGESNNGEDLFNLTELTDVDWPSSDYFMGVMNAGKRSFHSVLICKKAPRNVYSSSNTVDTNVAHYTYQELIIATDGFKDELGKGSFGIVYKGILGSNTVAVKKLDRVFKDGEKEFKTEVNAIARTHHKNLVQLLGYCDDSEQRLLIYEYMSNGTLAGFLFGDIRPSWKQRTYIAVGIAKGLSYLHEECSTHVIHCDIKPQNILLDDYYNAKISDFGLAKILMMNQSRTSTGIRGTKGYVAPEWFRNIPVTVKVDVLYDIVYSLFPDLKAENRHEEQESMHTPGRSRLTSSKSPCSAISMALWHR
nr:G-type lectin S-receptor-like serine/threonine-protein kinase LECRK3 [Tanacetum cinerariifolium]